MIAQDRDATREELLQLMKQLVEATASKLLQTEASQSSDSHPFLLAAVVNFCGSYAPAWNVMDCPPEVSMQLLSYLRSALGILPVEGAKAIRAIYISCLTKSMPDLENIVALQDGTATNGVGHAMLPLVLQSVRECMEAAVLTNNETAMTTIAEGATRLVTKLKDPSNAHQAVIGDLLQPVLHRGQTCLRRLPPVDQKDRWMGDEVQAVLESFSQYLAVVQIIVRFSDVPHFPAMGEWLVQEIAPFLEDVYRHSVGSPAEGLIIPRWVAVHQQLLRVALPNENMTMAIFSRVIPFMVKVLELTQDGSTLKYMSTAVERFGSKSDDMDRSFRDLLVHVNVTITSHKSLSEAKELLQAYFECLQRFILYSSHI